MPPSPANSTPEVINNTNNPNANNMIQPNNNGPLPAISAVPNSPTSLPNTQIGSSVGNTTNNTMGPHVGSTANGNTSTINGPGNNYPPPMVV